MSLKSITVQADLNRSDQIKSLFNIIKKKSFVIDCLVNNASAFNYDNLYSVSKRSWDKHVIPNLYAPLKLSKEFVRRLPAQLEGNIINILENVYNIILFLYYSPL